MKKRVWMTTSEDRMIVDGGVDAYFFRSVKSDCNGKEDRQWAENKNIPSTLNVPNN